MSVERSAPRGAVFLSYASQDAAAALRLCSALRAAGVEVWFDQNELDGGDAWDAKIRKQIAECALFVPIISAATQARTEGYFRLEWKLAAQRTHMIADDAAFLLPVVIDETRDADARVPAEFKSVQWTRLPGGEAPEKFCARVKTLLGGETDQNSSAVGARLVRAREDGRGRAAPLQKSSRPWLLPALIAGAAIAALAIWQPWKAPGRPPLSVQPAAPATPDSKATSLVARARAIYETGLIANEEDLKLAERFAREATELEPFNGEAWAARALASAQIFYSGFDASDVRRAEVLTAAQRAVKLDPGSAAAKLALATSLSLSRDTRPEAGRIAQALAARPDASGMALFLQTKLLVVAGDTAGAAPLFERLLAMPGFAAQAHLLKREAETSAWRLAEATIECDRAIALEPHFADAQVARIELFMMLAEREKLRRALQELPARLKTDVRLAGIVFTAHWWLRDGDNAARALENLPQEYIEAWRVRGPKAMYLGLAHRVAGRREAAVVEWQGALRTLDKRLASGKTDPIDVADRTLVLACLGREAEALDSLRLYEQLMRLPVGRLNQVTFLIAAELGQEERIATYLTEVLSSPDSAKGVAGYFLPLDSFDRYRERPWFRELNRRAEEILANARLPAGTAKAVPPPAAAVAPQAAAKSVAVLAFKNLSGDPAREFFSDGLSDVVSDVLGRVPGLKVVGSASALSFKGKAVPIPEIARQLGVTHLVEGTVLQEGTNVRITAKLIKADGFQEWGSDPLERESKNIFALYDEVAALIAKNLSLKLGASSAVSKVAINPEAFELYVQARQAWSLRTTAGFERAESALIRALALEPNFARAHAALADVWAQRLWRNLAANEADAKSGGPERARIKAKITHALMLDSNSAEAHAALGDLLSHDGQNAEAERALRRAVVLNPNLAVAHQWLGLVLLNTGNIDAALNHLKLATELDPFAPVIWRSYGSGLRCAGRYSESILAANRALLLKPDEAQALWDKLTNLVALGRSPEAAELVRPLVGTNGLIGASKLFVFAQTGLKAEAEALLTERRSSRYWAGGLITLGRTEEAVTFLTTLWFHQYFAAEYLWDPIYDPIRNDPRWMKLIADAGLTEAHARAQAWRKAHPPEKPAK